MNLVDKNNMTQMKLQRVLALCKHHSLVYILFNFLNDNNLSGLNI